MKKIYSLNIETELWESLDDFHELCSKWEKVSSPSRRPLLLVSLEKGSPT